MNLSNYLAGVLLNHAHNQTAWTAPTTLYLALLSQASAASDDTTTNASKELSGNGYSRQGITLGAHVSRIASNTGVLTFGPATAAWSTATHGWIVDASSGGNILYQGALQNSKTVGNTDSLVFAIGEIQVTLA